MHAHACYFNEADSGRPRWMPIHIGDPITKRTGFATVHEVTTRTNRGPMVAKMFNPQALKSLRNPANFDQVKRLVLLVSQRDSLRVHPQHPLDFVTWPRRLITSDPDIIKGGHFDITALQAKILGFTMERLTDTRPLRDFLTTSSKRTPRDHQTNIHIACHLAHQIARLHEHPYRFVFGDLSPNNVHISTDMRRVHFIDADSYQLTYALNHGDQLFRVLGFTPNYVSPDEFSNPVATAQHDDFVLAILLLQLLMAQRDIPVHPFDTQGEINHNRAIKARDFLFDRQLPHKDKRLDFALWNEMHTDLRAAFRKSFTSNTPTTARQWTQLLSCHWRSL
ncbi:hypothetical protein [Hyphomicrobium sp. CS1BSMeth3]|uniref:hypothetical protein n=1 Tax=Hyphomicrobium sp. CS1BSMeth3 TaxID=1892844 RepID=UPI000930A95C|nr:hypothetical protein [Hyphomicrobium sp. CS1BSMeth3]